MGAVGGLLGLAGGASGTGFAGPQGTTILSPTTTQQATDAYTSNQAALANQQAFLNAAAAQNGLQNQTNVFNQLQGVANGTGANPALAQLNQATAANTANQAALMAGQRGASANPGLIARQASQQGSANQQNAIGQAATLQAQQSLGALGQMSGLANTQAAQQQAAVNANTQAQQSEQQNLLNSIAQQNNANVGLQSNINNANANLAGTSMQGQQGLIGGGMNALGLAMKGASTAAAAQGGEVKHYDQGGDVNVDEQPSVSIQPDTTTPAQISNGAVQQPKTTGAKSRFGQTLFNMGSSAMQTSDSSPKTGAQALQQGSQNLFSSLMSNQSQNLPAQTAVSIGNLDSGQSNAAQGGKVPAMVSPGERYLSPKDVKKVEKGADPVKVSEKIPGKAKFKGNDYRNDTVPKTLEEGGIVLPKSVMEAKHPHWEAHKFVSAIMAKNGKSLPKGKK